ncbi:hypothetical protein MNAN1_003439 [Malassezia nana]|uniref:Uncharacterized protein n=1 Tax=Malassezia nana TaxID=180528 RepID=A0AAF0EPS8_9BASI|nr:hypothetical protein MNAN1_003439 [Malassezia nana]
MSSGTISTTGLIVGLTVGIGGGMLVICTLGLLSGYLARRRWIAKREESLRRARCQTWQPLTGSMLSIDVSHIYSDYTDMPALFQVPDMQNAPAALRPGAPPNPTPPLPALTTASHPPRASVSPPSAHPDSKMEISSDNVPGPSVSLVMPSGTQHAVPRTHSIRHNLNFSHSLSPKSSIRHASQRYSRLSQGMLSRFPSHFRSHRSSRPVSLESGESLGMPENQIPMVRRLTRKEPRFQYDSSSYSSSVGTPEEGEQPGKGVTSALVPPPPALLKPDEAELNDNLQKRIRAWQEDSMNAALPDDDAVSSVAELPSLSQYRSNRVALRRQDTRSSIYSMGSESVYTQSTLSEVLHPYMNMESAQLTRIPSIRPQFMAETSLDTWLRPDPPQLAKAEPTPESEQRCSALFTEVPMVISSDANATTTPPRASPAAELSRSASSGRASPYAPRTPSPLRRSAPVSSTPSAPMTTPIQLYLSPMNEGPMQPPSVSCAMSNSSRSSFPSSARFSNEISPNWKHNSHTTVSTDITWVESHSAVSKDPGAFGSPRLPKSGKDSMALDMPISHDIRADPDWHAQRSFSGATCVEAIGYAFDDPSDMDRAMMGGLFSRSPAAKQRRQLPAPPSRSASSQYSAMAPSTTTETGHHALASPGSPVSLSSPMQTMQAWYCRPDETDKATLVAPPPAAVI